MKGKLPYLVGGVLLVLFGGFTVYQFQASLTQYVTFDSARSNLRTVQVAGGLQEGSSSYDNAAEALIFTLEEPETGDTIRVRYHGLKPANFEEAVSIVAIGRYETGPNEFAADKLLVKCPSKYQGAEMETKEYG